MRRRYKHPGNREEITALEDALRFWQGRSYVNPDYPPGRVTFWGRKLTDEEMVELMPPTKRTQ